MNTLKLTLTMIATLAVFSACSDSPAMQEYKPIVAEACACTDAACAEAVDKKEQSWRQANFQELSQADRDAMKNARQAFTKCRDDLTKK